MKSKTLLLGGHMPSFDTLSMGISRGEQLGFSVVQMYARSEKNWVKHELSQEHIDRFREVQAASSIKYVVALDPFMQQLGMPGLKRPESMNELIADELELCDKLGIPYLILHPGTCGLRSETLECITDISENIDDILGRAKGDATILLQNMASGGNSICYTFEHMAQVYRDCKHNKRLGVCFDMCAAFSSGYSFGTEKEYKQMWEDFDRIVGFPLLKAIHINDSAEPENSGVISHEYIGKGKIPFEAYRLIMNDKRFEDIPKIIEIPLENIDEYKQSYQLLVDMLTPSNKHLYGIK